MGLKMVITGATGMVGEAVLAEALRSKAVERVLIINRRSARMIHPKLKEIIHQDFMDLTPIAEQLGGYDACLFCLGTTSVGKSEEEFTRSTYTLTMHFGETISKGNPGMTFCYISGAGTDSSERGMVMWARVKGKTENDLAKLPFKATYAFRPGFLEAMPGAKHTLKMYRYFKWLLPVIRLVAAKNLLTLSQLGKAMIEVSAHGFPKPVLEITDIRDAAQKYDLDHRS